MEWVRGPVVGAGSSATVSLAVVDDALVAAKSVEVSNSPLLQHEESVLRELQGCERVISCLGHGVTVEADGRRLYKLFLEYVPGGSLADLLRRRGGPLRESLVRRYTRSMLEGVSLVHGRGYVHCDVKPQNILVSGDGEVKIADFGLAKRAGERTGCSVRGTPLYMSPESVARREYEAPTDVWSLGCVVAEMAAGRPAWARPKDGWGLLMRIGFGDELPEIPAGMSDEGKDFLKRCFVRDPAMRWTAEMLLKHPFAVDEDCGGVDCQRLSPRSAFDFSRCEDPSTSPAICGYSPDFVGAGDRIGALATGQQPPEGWGCDSGDGWIRVRGEDSRATVTLKHSPGHSYSSCSSPEARIWVLATAEMPGCWCSSSSCSSSSPSKDGWICVREDEMIKRSDCCKK